MVQVQFVVGLALIQGVFESRRRRLSRVGLGIGISHSQRPVHGLKIVVVYLWVFWRRFKFIAF